MKKKMGMIVVKAAAAELAVTAAGIGLMAFLLLKWILQEEMISLGIWILYGAACLMGGCVAGQGAQQRKFFQGAFAGLLYFIFWCLAVLASGGMNQIDTWRVILTLCVCIGFGMAGGMISALMSAVSENG